jgi:hypothetical protein
MKTFMTGIMALLQLPKCTIHHTHLDDIMRAAFKEIQIFMYGVLEEHLQKDKESPWLVSMKNIMIL